MNSRIMHEPTPEGRIAAVAIEEMRSFVETWKRLPDVADLRDVLKAQVEREILCGKLEGLQVGRENCEEEIRKLKLIVEIAGEI